MSKTVGLADGTEVLIRQMTLDDGEASLAFFASLSSDDRAYLRRDLTRPEVVRQRVREVESESTRRIVALVGEEIVADGTLELSQEDWKRHVGELRLLVAPAYQRKGLGLRMARELFQLAAGERVEEILVRMMRPQKAARAIFRKLGFHREVVMPDYVKDRNGGMQDMILMRCDLEALWQKMEDVVAIGDWQRTQ